ncbi:MAG TPA: cupin domain-containing protein [Bosea sp. (in: a-proteobacteria)]|uniref:cupin domain-containing protein n=1 Tax=Bosea sp. (in: a-proteobacteria) TaxID=1871050 RepID=UPI002E0F61B2|nr:cupin domain-containing protein [Bosea sp. (in: a-proteobacteria)]
MNTSANALTAPHADAPTKAAEGDSVGAKIRKSRQAARISLQKLAERSGVSVGMLSQVERDLVNPSLRVLTSIRNALGLPASAFFQETAQPAPRDPMFVRRAQQRPRLELGYISKELLSAGSPHNLQLMILHIPAGSSSGDKPMRYQAEKAGLVLDGEFILKVADEESHLKEGDSFVFDSSLPHSFTNPGTTPAQVLWIIGSISVDRHV